MIADCYKITDFGLIKPGEEIPEGKAVVVEEKADKGGGDNAAVPVEAKKTRRRKKAE